MGKNVQPPQSPNFQASAADQAAANKEAALWSAQTSNPNVVNPIYAQRVTWQGNIPTVTQGFNPNTQAGREAAAAQAYQYTAYNLLNQLAANRTAAVGNILNQPFSLYNYGNQTPRQGTQWMNNQRSGFNYPGAPGSGGFGPYPNQPSGRIQTIAPPGYVPGNPTLPNPNTPPTYNLPNFGVQGTDGYRRR